ncbi:sorting nexin-16-like [Amphiura filiformis]|uniref:sorting nexin-16-like n=1 Tax=Amphiura filiformis TaxID=82378 RepID=UPI003B210690
MEQRAKFTVFRIQVQFSEVDSWFIFRRYTDFVRLNDRLRLIYPSFRLALPPKRWFGSNFDPNFLEDRQLGLQAFLNNITGHKEIVQSDPVREFFCLDDPPGAHDSLEESRALCESLEETVYNLRKDLATRDTQLARTKLELAEARHAIASLLEQGEKAGIQLSCPDINSSSPSIESDSSAADFMSRVEADQVRPMEQQFRQEHRTQQPTGNVINLSPERSTGIFSSPNCNINNSTEYSLHVHNIASAHKNLPETSDECFPEQNGHSVDNADGRAVPAVAKIISVT